MRVTRDCESRVLDLHTPTVGVWTCASVAVTMTCALWFYWLSRGATPRDGADGGWTCLQGPPLEILQGWWCEWLLEVTG